MRLAAIDLGSNSFRLEIARIEDGRILSEGSWKETVRLAAGIDKDGYLTDEAQKRALAALARIGEKIVGFPRAQIRAVGTQTLRVAKNSAEFLKKAEEVLGCHVEILRGREEARLVFEGCSFALPQSTNLRLIVDIGGASTECVVGRGHEMLYGESFHVGCVNTSVQFFKEGKLTASRFRDAVLSAEAVLDGWEEKFIDSHWDEAYGSSGTIQAVSAILKQAGLTDGAINKGALEKLKDMILSAGNIEKLRFEGLKDDRKEVLAGGVAVLTAVFNKLCIRKMYPADGALRYGILYDLAGRKHHKDIRADSVEGIIKRFSTDAAQSERVTRIALDLLEKLDPDAPYELKKELEWAARLHEIGLALSRSDYHKHSEYLIRNSDIAGFSRSEQEEIGSIVLGHRGSLRKVAPLLENTALAELVFCLRIAAILAHARMDRRFPEIELKCSDHTFSMKIPKAWLKEHPLTEYLLLQEEKTWEKVGYKFRVNP